MALEGIKDVTSGGRSCQPAAPTRLGRAAAASLSPLCLLSFHETHLLEISAQLCFSDGQPCTPLG